MAWYGTSNFAWSNKHSGCRKWRKHHLSPFLCTFSIILAHCHCLGIFPLWELAAHTLIDIFPLPASDPYSFFITSNQKYHINTFICFYFILTYISHSSPLLEFPPLTFHFGLLTTFISSFLAFFAILYHLMTCICYAMICIHLDLILMIID